MFARTLKPLFDHWIIAVLALFLTFLLFVRAIDTTYMHEDEELSYRTTTGRTLAYVVQYEAAKDVHPPLWYALFWVWQGLVGDSEFMGRLHSVLISMVSLALTYRMGKRWFGAAHFGLFALAALGCNAFFFIHALDIRPYAMVMLAAAICMWAFQRWLEKAEQRAALVYGMTVALMLYVHYYTGFLVLAQGVGFTLQRPHRTLILQGLGAIIVAFLLWAPWLPVFASQLLTIRNLAEQGGGSFALGAPTESTSQAIAHLAQMATNGLPLLYIVILLIGLVNLRRRRAFYLALLWALLVPAIILTANLFAAVYTQRYIAYISVGAALALGASLASLPARVRWLALIGFIAVSLWGLPAQRPLRVPYRALLRELSANYRGGDVLLLDRAREDNPVVNWQFQHYLTPDQRDNVVVNVNDALRARRIWFTTADLLAPDVYADFKVVEQTHPQQQTVGQCNEVWCYVFLLMESPPLDQPVAFEDNMAFWGVDVDAMTHEAITTRLWWRVAQTPSGDYSLGLYLFNHDGALVAQIDGPINNYGNKILSTNQLQPGAIYIDYRSLPLPRDLLPGDYHLMLSVYRWRDGSRLKLPNGTDLLLLDTINFR